MTGSVQRLLGIFVATVALTACSGDSDEGQRSSPSVTSTTTASLSPAEERLAAIYVTALRAHLTMDSGVANPVAASTTYAGSTTHVPPAVQAAITEGLAPRFDVSWTENATPRPTGDGSAVRLPQVPAEGDRVKVHLSTYCGNVCGLFVTWVVTRHGERWSARSTGGIGQA